MDYRKLKFRAISTEEYQTSTDGIEKGKFAYGYYYFCKRRMSGIIVTELEEESGGVGSGLVQFEIEVDYKTVGQYAGLKDKKKKGIYEGDIVRVWDRKNYLEKIVFEFGSFVAKDLDGKVGDGCGGSLWNNKEFTETDCEVIGNVHENKKFYKIMEK